MTLDVQRLGRLGYQEALDLQLELVEARRRGRIGDQILLLEHDSVFTVGRRGQATSLPADATVVEVARGGDVTWHGPGQLVGYWIRRLDGVERDLHAHLRRIEGNLIRVLAAFGLEGHRIPGRTGVFCQGHKIVSIGVGVRHWVTYHGFALNRCVDLEIYRHFRPCGLDGDIMTDLSQLLGHVPQDTQVMDHVAHVFRSPGPMKS